MCKQDAGRDCVEVQPSPGPAPGGWSETGQPAAGGGLVCHPAQPSPSSDRRAEQNCGETRGAAELTEEARLNPRPPDPQAPAVTPASQPHRQVSRPSVSQPDSQAAGWLPEGQGPLSSNVAFAQDSPSCAFLGQMYNDMYSPLWYPAEYIYDPKNSLYSAFSSTLPPIILDHH